MKNIFFSVILFSSISVTAQIDSLISAERRFAKYALDVNTKEAFLKFMDTNAIVFNKGVIENAVESWSNRKVNPAKLIWEPAYAILSASKDIGITTGPWWYKQTMQDTVLAQGHFATVWHKTSAGEWKWIVDLGIDHDQKNSPVSNVNAIALTQLTKFSLDAKSLMHQAEANLIKDYTANGKQAFAKVADDNLWFNKNGAYPSYTLGELSTAVNNIPDGIEFKMAGSGISKEGDLGYVYGYASLNGKTENYLRVWKRAGRKWTLILQTLTI